MYILFFFLADLVGGGGGILPPLLSQVCGGALLKRNPGFVTNLHSYISSYFPKNSYILKKFDFEHIIMVKVCVFRDRFRNILYASSSFKKRENLLLQ